MHKLIKKKILCTICARKGSKGLRNKNFLKLLNKPLILYSIQQAKNSKAFSKIVVSSDSKKILNFSKKKIDLTINRPNKYSNDRSSKIEAIRHALIVSEKRFNTNFDIIVDLDITSPLRSSTYIKKAINLFMSKNCTNLVSGSIAKKNPFFNQVMFKKKKLSLVCKSKRKIVRRQSAPKVYDLNASIYIWNRKSLIKSTKLINKNSIFFEMPQSRSIDIDDKFDFLMVKLILKNILNK